MEIFMKWLFSPVILIPLALIILVWILKYKDYKDSAYYRITKNSYFSVMFDLGRWGEYLTYRHLKKFEKDGDRNGSDHGKRKSISDR